MAAVDDFFGAQLVGMMLPSPTSPSSGGGTESTRYNSGGQFAYTPEVNQFINAGGAGGTGPIMQPPPDPRDGAGAPRSPGDVGIDKWQENLRSVLGPWLMQNFASQLPGYGGPLSFDMSSWFNDAAGAASAGIGRANQFADSAMGMLMPLFASMGSKTSALSDEMMKTGGLPNITPLLDAIASRGRMGIQDQLAGIKEEFGSYGLGRSSDIAEALARGASRGEADLAASQQAIAYQAMNDAQNRRLAGGNLALGAAQAQSGIGSTIGSLGSMVSNAYGNASSLFGNIGQADNARMLSNLSMPYNEFQRTTSYPFLNAALGFATSNPPQDPIIEGQSGMGSFLSFLGPMLGMFFSSSKLKEDIEPVDSVTDKLKTLPIYRWKYKGDKNAHIGPMAEDFQKTFGVGDGVTLNPIDLFGVMLASMKEMSSHA